MKGRVLVIALLLVIAAFYVLEQYVLVGKVLVNATANITDMNPRPGVTIPVLEAGTTVRVYLKADDMSVDYTLLNPEEAVIREENVDLGRTNFRFDAPDRGSYLLVLRSDAGDQGPVTVSVWANDSRLLYGFYF